MAIKTANGVQFAVIAPGGFEILRALGEVSKQTNLDLTITSGTDGAHSGLSDPHHKGEAYDIRSHDLINKQDILTAVMEQLGQPSPSSGGYVTAKFFGWLEQAGTDNEHFHFQLRHGQVYP
jgi:hypothetical protein